MTRPGPNLLKLAAGGFGRWVPLLAVSHGVAAFVGAVAYSLLFVPHFEGWMLVLGALSGWPLIGFFGVRAALAPRRNIAWLVALIAVALAAFGLFMGGSWAQQISPMPWEYPMYAAAHLLYAAYVYLPGSLLGSLFHGPENKHPRLTIRRGLVGTALVAALFAMVRQTPHAEELWHLSLAVLVPCAGLAWLAHWCATALRRRWFPRLCLATSLALGATVLSIVAPDEARPLIVVLVGNSLVSLLLFSWWERIVVEAARDDAAPVEIPIEGDEAS